MSTSNTEIAQILSVKKNSGEWAQHDLVHSVPKTESGAIDLTKAERIAEGGTHVLYRFPDASFVIKLMKQNPNPMELEELEKKYAVLYDCFDKDGKQRCIREQHITCHVLLTGKEPQSAALSIVPYEKCFKSKVKFDFKIEPAELDIYLMEHNQDLFDKAHKALIQKDEAGVDFELNGYAIIDERIGAILQRLDSDPKLREVMIEFLDHYRDFYQKTNIILDAMGFENILFFKDEQGDWQFKVGSAIKHDTGKYTQELFDTLHSGKEVDLTSFVNFTHAYFSPANIRAVNVCAMKLGLEPVIHDITIDSNDLLRISQELSVGERMLAYARHGDFEKMDKILQEHRGELSFNFRDFWTYSLIAEEYIKHGQPPTALKNYLDTVSQLPIILPENEDDAKRVADSKKAIIDQKSMHDKKIMLHQELTTFVLNKGQLQKIIDSAHTPAVSYAYVESKEQHKHELVRTSLALGKKNGQSTGTENTVDGNTRFPASSLSKIVFTYLVLQLVKEKQIDLDDPLLSILQQEGQEYERFKVHGEYPEKATQLTARHVLSHTTGLPNWSPDLSSTLTFDPKSDLGTGYSYSGEAFLYLQKVIETKTGKNLETLAKEYVFEPLRMGRSTFRPQPEDDKNIVVVHTQLEKSTPILEIEPPLHSAASLLTTANDFSKFMSAWLDSMDDPIIKQAFEPKSAYSIANTCGLGWHLYKNKDAVIAYQWGANPNTRSFIALNVTEKKGAVFFTNSENGMSIATQILNSPNLPPIGDMQELFKYMSFSQSDEPGWQETIAGKISEDEGRLEEARHYFEKAIELRRLEWSNAVHQISSPEKKEFTSPLETFVGNYNDEAEVYLREGSLICRRFNIETKLVRISETEFLPEEDPSFKISFKRDLVEILSIHGDQTLLFKHTLPKSQLETDHEKTGGAKEQPSLTPVDSEKKVMLHDLMKKAYIPGISIATISDGTLSWNGALGISDMDFGDSVDESTVFEACSLSKPLFAYLVLKLIEKDQLPPDFLTQSLPEIEYGRFKSEDKEKVVSLTPQMILSHQTGLPNWEPGNNQLEFQSKPGDKYYYSGEGYHYLQKVIEAKTGKSLETLAQEYVFTPLGMKNSHFERARFEPGTQFASRHNELMQPQPYRDESTAAGSLQTTAYDYAQFVMALLKEQTLRKTAMKELVSTEKDELARKKEIPQEIVQSVCWGLGWGLEKTEEGTLAFHWGDTPGTKAFVAINPETGSAICYFANSQNGLSLVKEIVTPHVGLTKGLDYLCGKYDYTPYDKPGYKERHEGLLAESRGDYVTAKIQLLKAIELEPKYTSELTQRIECYDRPGWKEQQEGIIAELNGDYKTAIIKFNQALVQDLDSEQQIQKHLAWLNDLDHPRDVCKEKLQEYTGKYGPHEITLEGESLKLQSFGQSYKLIPVGKNIFSPENNLNFRLKFDKERGHVAYHFLDLAFQPIIEKKQKATAPASEMKLEEVMKKSGIPGISVVTVNHEGIISPPLVKGTVSSTQCGLLKMSVAKTIEEQSKFYKSYYILTEEGLLYYNKSKDKLHKLELDEYQLEELRESFAKDEQIDILSDDQLSEITSITDHLHSSPSMEVTSETVFGAASLSKPVFAYLVLKLIAANNANEAQSGLGQFNAKFDLKTPLYEVFPDILKKFRKEDEDKAKLLTAEMVLSHTTGLPITHDESKGLIEFQFDPGTKYAYSGPGIAYLQEVIEALTGSNLETLAQEHILGEKALNMKHSSFHTDKSKFPQAANSLYTTPSDYAKFIVAWLNDEELQYAFQPNVFMNNDYLPGNWPIEANRLEQDRNHVAWGLGFGLQTNEQCGCGLIKMTTDPSQFSFDCIESLLEDRNAVILFNDVLFYADQTSRTVNKIELTESNQDDFNRLKAKCTESYKLAEGNELKLITSVTGLSYRASRAYHSGDMNEWRAWVAMNLEDKSAVVYFANSHNGHILADSIISPEVEIENVFNYFFQTYGFARNFDELGGITNFHGVNSNCLKKTSPKIEEKPDTSKELEKGTTSEESAPLTTSLPKAKTLTLGFLTPEKRREKNQQDNYCGFKSGFLIGKSF
ncbi:serine hydrolase domain-containing protein [Legionella worsleiensis]|uniref:Putative secreted esterase n=1 Tax=Legionella worsleiensis TaxID=45076 RepID=A0A0W1AKE5_9GAMM|nr:serine hydrolase [Legionella worsleiensis]KTD81813.1 putative secreted esterase [Legionella worsleiensis]STY31068.1 putative secreted esterase [Legionella worsleiensis]